MRSSALAAISVPKNTPAPAKALTTEGAIFPTATFIYHQCITIHQRCIMLTVNEKKVIRYLLVNFNIDKSINEVAKDCHLSPNGAHKILQKLEAEKVLYQKNIANIKSFKLTCGSLKAKRIIEWSFMDKIEGRLEHRYKDFLPLQKVAEIGIAFGSYVTAKKIPEDFDLMLVIDKSQFTEYKKTIKMVQEVVPLKIHDVIQTKSDFINNLRQDNKVIKKALQEGIVLWGHEQLIEVLSNVC